MSDRHTDRMQQDADRTVLSVPEAAERLGVTPDAIRARLHRGTLEGEKHSGQWRVFVPADRTRVFVSETETPNGDQQAPTGNRHVADRTDYAERYAQLERENERLWTELEARTEEIRRRDHIIAGLVERLPAIAAGESESRPPDAVVTRSDGPGRAEPAAVGEDASRSESSRLGRLLHWLRGT